MSDIERLRAAAEQAAADARRAADESMDHARRQMDAHAAQSRREERAARDTDRHHHRPAARRPATLTRNQRVLLLAALALAVFWLGCALLSIYAIAGSMLLGGAALALSLDRPTPTAAPSGVCRACGCTDEDCTTCIQATGQRCGWVDLGRTMCSRCAMHDQG